MKMILFASLLPVALGAFDVTKTSVSSIPSSQSVCYSCSFDNNWSGSNHPINYPSNAHWSPHVLAAHSSGYSMWKEGGIATDGIEDVAETGGIGNLIDELENIDPTPSIVVGNAMFNRDTQSQTFTTIKMTPTNNYLSTVSMIAPSPDWFTGFYDFNPVDAGATNNWYGEFIIDTYPWDAGTEQGDTYSGDNDAIDPKEPIMRLTKDTVPSNGVLLNSAQDDVLPVATWTCSLDADQSDCAEFFIPDAPDCFSSSVNAFVKGRGKVPMNEITVGDQVLTGTGNFEAIYSIDHRDPTKDATFFQIHYKSGKEQDDEQQSIELTKNHMIFVDHKTNPVPAKTVTVGDQVLTVDGPCPVTKITTVIRKGVFNPLTADGTIIADGVISSTYSTLTSNSDSIEIFGYKSISYQDFFKNVLKPYTFLCTSTTLDICKTQKEKVLISEYASRVFFSLQNGIYQTVILFSSFVFVYILNVLMVVSVPATICWMIIKGNKSV